MKRYVVFQFNNGRLDPSVVEDLETGRVVSYFTTNLQNPQDGNGGLVTPMLIYFTDSEATAKALCNKLSAQYPTIMWCLAQTKHVFQTVIHKQSTSVLNFSEKGLLPE
jgi:hypothetical protein